MSFKALLLLSALVIGIIPFVSAETSYEEWDAQRRQQAETAEMPKDLKISVDKTEYLQNQSITFTFSSDTFYKGRIIEVLIASPSGNVAAKTNYMIESENSSFKITESLRSFTETGTYKVLAGYDDARAETTFKLIVPNSPTPQPPEPVLKDSFVNEQVDPNEKTPQKEIALLKAENEKLKSDLDSMNQKLDSLNAVLLEQTKVLIDLAKSISELKNTLAQVFYFDIFA